MEKAPAAASQPRAPLPNARQMPCAAASSKIAGNRCDRKRLVRCLLGDSPVHLPKCAIHRLPETAAIDLQSGRSGPLIVRANPRGRPTYSRFELGAAGLRTEVEIGIGDACDHLFFSTSGCGSRGERARANRRENCGSQHNFTPLADCARQAPGNGTPRSSPTRHPRTAPRRVRPRPGHGPPRPPPRPRWPRSPCGPRTPSPGDEWPPHRSPRQLSTRRGSLP